MFTHVYTHFSVPSGNAYVFRVSAVYRGIHRDGEGPHVRGMDQPRGRNGGGVTGLVCQAIVLCSLVNSAFVNIYANIILSDNWSVIF